MTDRYLDPQPTAAVDFGVPVGAKFDWRSRVGERVQRLWPTLTDAQRQAIAADAADFAEAADYD
jgi:hypothetical protein